MRIHGTWYTYTKYGSFEVSEQTIRGTRTNNTLNSDKSWDYHE